MVLIEILLTTYLLAQSVNSGPLHLTNTTHVLTNQIEDEKVPNSLVTSTQSPVTEKIHNTTLVKTDAIEPHAVSFLFGFIQFSVDILITIVLVLRDDARLDLV